MTWTSSHDPRALIEAALDPVFDQYVAGVGTEYDGFIRSGWQRLCRSGIIPRAEDHVGVELKPVAFASVRSVPKEVWRSGLWRTPEEGTWLDEACRQWFRVEPGGVDPWLPRDSRVRLRRPKGSDANPHSNYRSIRNIAVPSRSQFRYERDGKFFVVPGAAEVRAKGSPGLPLLKSLLRDATR